MPPLRGTEFTEKMASAAKSLGWHPFTAAAAINSRTYQNRGACMYHGFCNRGGCHVDAKASTLVTTIPKAQKTGRFDVVPLAHVTTIETDGSGRVTGVNYVTNGMEYFQPAKVVLLASYVYENVRLMLLSKSKAFPNGLSNNHGQVGRHYMSHAQTGAVAALFPWNINNWYGMPAQGIAVDNFADQLDHAGMDFIGGDNLWIPSDRRRSRPSAAARSVAHRAGVRHEGVDRGKRRPHEPIQSAEDDAAEDNYLDLDPSSGSARVSRDADHGRLQGQRKEDQYLRAEKMSQWYARPERSRCSTCRWAPWVRRRTRTAALGWGTTQTPTSSTGGAFHMKCPISASSARRSWAPAARGTPP
jgi:hypothetical protein